MTVKTFEGQYELAEFNHYIDHSYNEPISVVELTLKTNEPDYVKDDLKDLFAIEAGKQVYVFSDYEISECYEVTEGLIKVVCIK